MPLRLVSASTAARSSLAAAAVRRASAISLVLFRANRLLPRPLVFHSKIMARFSRVHSPTAIRLPAAPTSASSAYVYASAYSATLLGGNWSESSGWVTATQPSSQPQLGTDILAVRSRDGKGTVLTKPQPGPCRPTDSTVAVNCTDRPRLYVVACGATAHLYRLVYVECTGHSALPCAWVTAP